eukprot:3125246-Rhodomonas_salina.1
MNGGQPSVMPEQEAAWFLQVQRPACALCAERVQSVCRACAERVQSVCRVCVLCAVRVACAGFRPGLAVCEPEAADVWCPVQVACVWHHVELTCGARRGSRWSSRTASILSTTAS